MAPPTPAANGNTKTPQVVNVFSKAEVDEIGVETLVGEYVESGMNHGRKVFKRKRREGDGGLVVLLYFWDQRDGEDFSGWWFGDRVGGAQVWSRCATNAMMPPSDGWCIPWDGDVVETLGVAVQAPTPAPAPAATVAKKTIVKQETLVKKEIPAPEDNKPSAEDEERIQRSSDRVIIAEIEASQVLESTSAMMEGEVSEEALKAVEDLLQVQQAALTEAHKVLAAEIMEGRKQAPKAVASLRKLTPRLRSVSASLAQELAKAKSLMADKNMAVAEEQAEEEAKVHQAQMDHDDSQSLEEGLQGLMDAVAQAEDLVTTCASAAAPLLEEFKDDVSDAVTAVFDDVERAATKAEAAITAGKQQLSMRMTAAKKYAPNARKNATAEFHKLQEKLSEANKTLTPYLSMRKDHEQKLEAKKALAAASDKLATVEVEVEKLMETLVSPKAGEDELKAIETVIAPVETATVNALKFVKQRIEHAKGKFKEELAAMQQRGNDAKARIDEFRKRLKTQSESLQLNLTLQKGLDQTLLAEELLLQTVIAEEPFLKENLPADQVSEAVKACEEAAQKAETAANQAKAYLKARLEDTGKFPESMRVNVKEELQQLQFRVDAVVQKVGSFKRETATRRASLLLGEVVTQVVEAEDKVAKAVESASTISLDKMETSPLNELHTFTVATLEAEKVAGLACAEARNVLSTKQKEGPGKDASPVYSAELSKLTSRLGTAAQELQKLRKVVLTAEKTWKNKQLLHDKDVELKKVEEEISRVEIMTTPLGGDGPTDEEVVEMDLSVTNVQKLLTGVVKDLEPATDASQGTSKAALSNLLARAAKAQDQLSEVATQTREMRERVQCDQILRDAKLKLKAVDEAFQKTSDAESPYMKGLEVLPMEEASRAVAECEGAAADMQQAIGEARSFLAEKSLELRKFLDVVGRSGLVEIGRFSERNESALAKLAEFKKETQKRKGVFLLQEAGAKVTDAEEAVQKTILKAAPLAATDVEAIAPDVAQDLCEKLNESEKESLAKLEEARKALVERQKDKKASHDPADVTKLLGRLNSAQADLTQAKSTASEHEQRFVARMITMEVEQLMQDFNVKLESSTVAAAPLVVEGGKSFVVASMTSMLFEAFGEHVQKNNLTKEALFKELSGGKEKISGAEFYALLEKVPELCSRPDLAFSKEQGDAIFEHLDPASKGISLALFLEQFRERELTAYAEFMIALEKELASCQTASKDVTSYITQKYDELRECKKGPLSETKGNLTKLRPQVSVLQAKLDQLKKRVEEGKREHQKREEFEKKKQEEKKERAVANALVKSISDQVEQARGGLKKVEEAIAPLVESASDPAPHPTASPLTMRKTVEAAVREAQGAAASAATALKMNMSKHSKATAGPWAKALEEMGLLQDGLVEVEAKVNALSESADSACDTIGAAMLGAASSVIQASIKSSKTTIEKQFAKLAGGAGIGVTEDKFTEYMKSLHSKGAKLSPEQTQLLFKQVSSEGAITCHRFRGLIERFLLCTKGVSLTSDFDIKVESVEERKFAVGEAAEILEGPKRDESAGLVRYKVKALTDGQEGWVTAKGSEGTLFMKTSGKPCLFATKAVLMQDDIVRNGAKAVKTLGTNEVIELIEGPRKEGGSSVSRAKAKTADGSIGWFTFKNNKGQQFAEPGKLCFVTKGPIALTDGINIKDCKVVRKLDKGENLVCVEGPVTDDTAGVTRIRVSVMKEGKESQGWVTTKGNAGSVYAEESGCMYTITASTSLQEGFESESKEVATLEAGASITLLDGPRDEKPDAALRVKGRVMSTGEVGWATVEAGNLKPWGPRYRCVNSTAINDIMEVASESAQTLRKLEVGETVEFIEGPRLEAEVGIVRVRARADRDGVVGWISIAGNQGKPFLKVAVDQ